MVTVPLSSFLSKSDQLFYLKLEIVSSLNHVRLGRVLRKMLGMGVILSSKIESIRLEKTSDNKSSVASGKSNSEASVNCLDAFITEVLGTRVVSNGYL